MATATTNQETIAIVKEVTYGTSPTSGYQEIERVSFDGDPKPTILIDSSINSNNQLMSQPQRGNESIEGTLEIVYGPTQYDGLLESLFGDEFATNVLKLGTDTVSFSLEDKFTELTQFRVFSGLTVNSMKVTASVNDYVKASFGFKAKGLSAFSGTSIDADGYTAVPNTTKFFHNGGTFKEGGSTLAYFKDIEFEVSVPPDDVFCQGSTAPYLVSRGKIEVKGKANLLFNEVTYYNKFRNNTSSSLEFTWVGGANTHKWTFPKVAYTSAPLKRNDNSVIEVELNFTGYYDSSSATTVSLTRT